MDWSSPASESSLNAAVAGLAHRGFKADIVDDPAAAREFALKLIPRGAEIMNATSVTVDECGFTKDLLETDRYVALRKKMMELPKEERATRGKHITAAPEWAVGSAHAVTEDGRIVWASASGSQIPLYAYTAGKFLLMIGSQKIVKTLDDAFKRIHEHALKLEDARARKAYGSGSSVNKVLILEKEPVAGRAHVVLIRKPIGF